MDKNYDNCIFEIYDVMASRGATSKELLCFVNLMDKYVVTEKQKRANCKKVFEHIRNVLKES